MDGDFASAMIDDEDDDDDDDSTTGVIRYDTHLLDLVKKDSCLVLFMGATLTDAVDLLGN